MRFASAVTLIAAFSCLEVSIIFAVLCVKVSRRKSDLLFSMLSLCFAWTLGCHLMFEQATEPRSLLFWLRMIYVGRFAALSVLLHFVSLTRQRPLHPILLGLNYVLGAVLSAVACTAVFFRLPSAAGEVSPASFAAQAHGPLYLLFPLMLLLILGAWLKLMRAPQHQRETAFAPLAARAPSLFASVVIVLVAAIVTIPVAVLPHFVFPVNPLSVAMMVFCLFTAVALGTETFRSVSEMQRLAQLVQYRDQAVRDVAHELRNPLTIVHGTVATVRHGMDRGLDEVSQREMLEICVETCRRLTRLVNNMLDTARMESGFLPEVRVEETDVPALVESVLTSHRATTSAHQLQLHYELPTVTMPVDADKLYQILSNLVHNAIKYSPQGGDVTVRLWAEDGEMHFSVSDQGIGITPEQQARLFQPFERVVDPERKITGTGIGLHLVKRLIEAHGGRIWVQSAQGRGSTFTFALPRGIGKMTG